MRRSLAEGPHVVESLAASTIAIESIFATEDDGGTADLAGRCGVELVTVTPEVLRAISTTRTPQSPVAVFAIPDAAPVRRHDQIVLWDLSDPGNVGTIIRTAVALGWDITVCGWTADPWSPKVVRSSAGAVFRARVAHIDGIATLHDLGVATAAAIVDAGQEPHRWRDEPLAILVGSEANGLPSDIVASADARWTIPMTRGSESLNAAMAAGILMYACSAPPSVGERA